MNINIENIHELAIRYFKGCLPLSDEKRLFQYICHEKGGMDDFRQWEREWLISDEVAEKVEEGWTRIQRRLGTCKALRPLIPRKRKKTLRIKTTSWVAVALLLLAIGVGIGTCISGSSSGDVFKTEIPYGEKGQVVLPDGSKVWLNSGSSLTYANRFCSRFRQVELIGEGYFEVESDPTSPFTVKTKGYDIVVKGTRFDVSAYPEDSLVTTVLLEGIVDISYKDKCLNMQPGESVSLDLRSDDLSKSRVNAALSNYWIDNRIEYESIALKELIIKLERQYDVKIHLLSEEVANRILRISLRNNESITEVMKALQDILSVTIRHKGQDIYISE